jgi:hypothetical protein
VALIGSDTRRENDTVNVTNAHFRYHTEQFSDRRLSSSLTYNVKISDKTMFKTGLILHQIFFDFLRKISTVRSQNNINDIKTAVSV